MSHKVDRFAHKSALAWLALACSFVLVSGAVAAPSDDIIRAIQTTGAQNITQASADQFERAFTSVLVRKKERDFPLYVSAAVNLRPDLADKIVASALKVYHLKARGRNDQLRPELIAQIIAAAVSAAPDMAAAIVRAAIILEPDARDSIVAAAIAAAPDQEIAIRSAANESQTIAFLQSRGAGNINPVDFVAQGPVTSEEQPPTGP